MTQESKKLLLLDLCARLPYGVKVYAGEDLAMTLKQIDYKCFCESWENKDFKCHSRWMFPYLRSMSSMTEEEKKKQKSFIYHLAGNSLPNYEGDFVFEDEASEYIDWLNAHHFDYRGLIEKGLALEAPKDMYSF